MRFDLQGFFWEDEARIGRSGKHRERPMPSIPDTGWVPPKDFPNLAAAKIISIDTETYDPHLRSHGPGWGRGDGEVVGVSLSVDRQNSWYFPVGHTVQAELNMDREKVMHFLRDNLSDSRPKTGANLQYDIGWLQEEKVFVGGMLYDIQYAEALIDDVARSYALETIAQKYLGRGKESSQLYKWSALAYGGKETAHDQGQNIYRCPPCLVGPYAEADAWEPLEILKRQWGILQSYGLIDLFKLECNLIRPLIGMRRRGMPVNLEQTHIVRDKLEEMERIEQESLNKVAGFEVNVYSNDDLQMLFDKMKVRYPRTAKGNPSFTAPWLEASHSKPAKLVNRVRKLTKARVVFIENGILDKHVDGKVHPSFHPLRGESGGAVSGRFSSSDPNAQQIPSRDKELAPMIRGIYIPEPGFTDWLKMDLSQIEYRMFAHYSQDDNLIQEYSKPGTDYHHIVSGFLGHKVPRPIIKNFNFMSLYGGGRKKTIKMIGDNLKKAEIEELILAMGLDANNGTMATVLGSHFVDLYAEQFPAAKTTMDRVSEEAQSTGEVRTILNRRSTFNLWEPIGVQGATPLPYKAAVATYGTYLQRAATYKALNRKLQGSAADLMKMGMWLAYDEGLFNEDKLGFPHVTVHDEFDFSYHPDLRQHFIRLKEVIEQSISLLVPVIMDTDLGPDWGHVKEFDIVNNVMVKKEEKK